MIDCNIVLTQKEYIKRLNKIALKFVPQDEKILIALKGSNREYLFCTDKCVYIIKEGFMTGHFLGHGNFKMPYSNITNVEIDNHLLTGYFEVSAGGLENRDLNFWANGSKQDPAQRPNCLAIDRSQRKDFAVASETIMKKVYEIANTNANLQTKSLQNSLADEIRKFKQLLDEGIITKEEFENKKQKLLNN